MDRFQGEISFSNIIEFALTDDVVIQYDMQERVWLALSSDEDNYPDPIVLDEKLTEDIELFDSYILTVDLFNQFKVIVEGEIQKWVDEKR